jgi:hypothetical protein
MNMPGFSAASSLPPKVQSPSRSPGAPTRAAPPFAQRARRRRAADAVQPQLPGSRFGPTLPTCHWEKQWVVCGSALPGYPTPMCLEWVYVCKFPGSSRGLLG